jgi:hypothetical protein
MAKIFLYEFGENDVPNTISDDEWLDLLQGVVADRKYFFEVRLTRFDGLDYDTYQNIWWSRAYKEAKSGPYRGESIADRNRGKADQMTRLFHDGEIWNGASLHDMLADDEVDESDKNIMTTLAEGDVYVSAFRVFTLLPMAGGGQMPAARPDRVKNPNDSKTFRKGRQGGYCPFINDSFIELKDIQIYRDGQEQDMTHCVRFSFEQYYLANQEELNRLRPLYHQQLEATLAKHLSDEGILASYKIFKPISEQLQLNISLSLYKLAACAELRHYKYPSTPNPDWPTVPLACYFDHYFYNATPSPPLSVKQLVVMHKSAEEMTYDDNRKRGNAGHGGKPLTYIQILARLRKIGKLTKYHHTATIFAAPGQVNKADLSREENMQRRFDAIDVLNPLQCRKHKQKKKKESKAFKAIWVGDCESYVGLTGRDPMHPYYKVGESEEEYKSRLETEPEILSRQHTLYLIGVCPIESTDEKQVKIFTSWNDCSDYFKEFYRDEAVAGYNSLSVKEKIDRGESYMKKPLVEITIFFHNLRYDKAIIQNEVSLNSICKKDNTIYDMSIVLDLPKIQAAIKIQFFDSVKHLQAPLRALASSYGLPSHLVKKDGGIYYQYFAPEKRHQRCTVADYISHRPFDKSNDQYIIPEAKAITEVTALLREVGLWFEDEEVSLNTCLDPDDLYEYYLTYDCLVLAGALTVYRSNIEQVCEDYIDIAPIDPLLYRTSSSVSMAIMSACGCFEGVHEYSGLLKEYIMRSVRGGRCNPHPDFENKLAQPMGGISDCDAVSLYPTAIKNLRFVPTCAPVKIDTTFQDFKWLQVNSEAAIVTVRITAIRLRKTYAQPIIAWKNPRNEIEYIQDLPEGQPFVVTVHFIELVEYVKYHNIAFDILYGLYWPYDPHSHSLSHVGRRWPSLQQKLFDARANAKALLKSTSDKKYDVQQGLLKLILNSMYGKTIMKPSNCKTIIRPFSSPEEKNTAWRYVYDRWGELSKAPDFTNRDMIVQLNQADDSFTFPLHGT